MNRRAFLLLTAYMGAKQALAAPPLLSGEGSHDQAQTETAAPIFSASDDEQGQHYLNRFHLNTAKKLSHNIPFRAHAILPLSDTTALAFGRRPRPQSIYVDMASGQSQLINAATGRHFYGHGCLSVDKTTLFTTENHYEAGKGVIGIRDAQHFQQIGEYSSYGVGPHDIHLMPDGKTLVVANGGIQTHPDYGRRKLNLKTMQPSLVYIDIKTGEKRDEYRLDDRLLSIRHLTVTAQGDVGVATQYQGDIYLQQPATLMAWQDFGASLEPLAIKAHDIADCRGYVADLAYDPEQGLLAATCPRGNQLTFWDSKQSRFLYQHAIPEVSGIQCLQHPGRFLVSNAQGQVFLIQADKRKANIITQAAFIDTRWDNHLALG